MGLLLRVRPGPPRCVRRPAPPRSTALTILGFEPRELIGRPSLELVHPDEFAQVRGIHYSTITQDQAAVLAYLRMRHKDPCKGYILCAIVSPRLSPIRARAAVPRWPCLLRVTQFATPPVPHRLPERPRRQRLLRLARPQGHAQRLHRPGGHHHHPHRQGL